MIGPEYASVAAAVTQSLFGYSVVSHKTCVTIGTGTYTGFQAVDLYYSPATPVSVQVVKCRYCGTFSCEQNTTKCKQCAAPLPL